MVWSLKIQWLVLEKTASKTSSASTKDITKDLEFQNNTIAVLTESLDDLKRSYEKLDETDFDNLANNIKRTTGLTS